MAKPVSHSASAVRKPRVATAKAPCADQVLQQFGAIARSAAGLPDWTREPLTEIERKVRAQWLSSQIDIAMSGDLEATVAKMDLDALALSVASVPSDLAGALQSIAALDEYATECKERHQWLSIAAQIEGLEPPASPYDDCGEDD